MSDGKGSTEGEKELARIMAVAVKKVTEDLDELGFNTAIAALMECVNELYKLKASHKLCHKADWQSALKTLLQLLAPFAPHISEELWQQLGQKGSVHISNWPTWDKKILEQDTMMVVVQVNGKLRANVEVPTESTEAQVVKIALADKKVAKYAVEDKIKKTIYVPNKLVNFVV